MKHSLALVVFLAVLGLATAAAGQCDLATLDIVPVASLPGGTIT